MLLAAQIRHGLKLLTGAAQVLLTDREPLALECALQSARHSGLSSVQPQLDSPLTMLELQRAHQASARGPETAPLGLRMAS